MSSNPDTYHKLQRMKKKLHSIKEEIREIKKTYHESNNHRESARQGSEEPHAAEEVRPKEGQNKEI